MSSITSAVLSLVVAGAGGCLFTGGNPKIDYVAQPARIQNPKETLKSLLVTTATDTGCEYTPEYSDKALIVKSYCHGKTYSPTIRFDKIQKIELTKVHTDSVPKYAVTITHVDNIQYFSWASPSLDDMQHLEDAVVAVQQELAGGAPAAGSQ